MNETNVLTSNEFEQATYEHFTCMFCESSDEITIQNFPYCMTCVLEMTEQPTKEYWFLLGCLP